MSEVAKLVVAALFALNQYVPLQKDNSKYQQYVQDVRSLSDEEIEELVFPAANASCLYMMEVFFVKTLGISGQDEDLYSTAMDMIGASSNTNGAEAPALKNSPYYERFKKAGINQSEMIDTFTKVCSQNFNANSWSLADRRAMREFINTKIKVLDDDKLASIGNFRFFGTSEVFDREGQAISSINTEGREWIAFHRIPQNIILALLATEDNRFEIHQGIDPVGLARMGGQFGQGRSHIAGGSTLTMQLLKNLYFGDFPEPEGSIFNNSDLAKVLRKAREIYWAKPYENFHGEGAKGKQAVLEKYLNLVPFGPNIQGIAQASRVFFGKDVADVTKGEAAFIVSLLKNPMKYSNPKFFRDTTDRVQNIVLQSMKDNNMFVSDIEYQDAMAMHLPDPNYAKAARTMLSDAFTYITAQARGWVQYTKAFAGREQAREVKVETTINSDLQQVVYNATRKILDRHDGKDSRKGLKRVGPALDATGKIASPLMEDISSSNIRDLKGAIEDLHALTDSIFMVSVFLGELEEGEKFYHIVNKFPDWPETVQQALNEKLSSHFSSVGQTVLVSIAAKEKCLPDMEDMDINEAKETKSNYIPKTADCLEIITGANDYVQDYQLIDFNNFAANTQVQVISDALDRIATGRSREEQIPAMFDGKDLSSQYLTFADGSRPRLRDSHLSHLRNLMARNENPLKVGNVVWLKPNGPAIGDEESAFEACKKRNSRNLSVCITKVPHPPLRPSNERIEALLANQKTDDELLNEILPEPIIVDGVIDMRAPEVIEAERLAGEIEIKLADQYTDFVLTPPYLQAAVLIMDSQNGEVLASFGGYNPTVSAFDRARFSIRQPGSTVKPWVYYLALQNGLSTHNTLKNSGVQIDQGGEQGVWVPGGSKIANNVSFYDALVHSQNQATAGLLVDERWNNGKWQENLQQLCSFLKDIKLYEEIGCFPSVVLGTQEVAIKDLVRSYTYFSNGQSIVKPQFIKRVTDGYGREYFKSEPDRFFVPNSSENTLFHIRNMMIQVNNRGTGKRLKTFLKGFGGKHGEYPFKHCFEGIGGSEQQSCFGGKTGTTNDAKDTWYVGYSNRYVIGVWVGYDQPEPIGKPSSGASIAFPIFEQILFSGYEYLPEIEPLLKNSDIPEGTRSVKTIAASGGRTCVVNESNAYRLPENVYTTVYTSTPTSELNNCNVCKCQEMKYTGSGDYAGHQLQQKVINYGYDPEFRSEYPLLQYRELRSFFDIYGGTKTKDLKNCVAVLLRKTEAGECDNDVNDVRSRARRLGL